MTPLLNNLTAPADRPSDDDTELVGSRMGRLDPDNFRSPSESKTDDEEDEALNNEPVDEDDDSIDKHDHQ